MLHNPEFYERQRMRASTWNIPRFLHCRATPQWSTPACSCPSRSPTRCCASRRRACTARCGPGASSPRPKRAPRRSTRESTQPSASRRCAKPSTTRWSPTGKNSKAACPCPTRTTGTRSRGDRGRRAGHHHRQREGLPRRRARTARAGGSPPRRLPPRPARPQPAHHPAGYPRAGRPHPETTAHPARPGDPPRPGRRTRVRRRAPPPHGQPPPRHLTGAGRPNSVSLPAACSRAGTRSRRACHKRGRPAPTPPGRH